MSSIARKQRRGKVDQFGRPLPKRLYNNKKRTKGRKGQEEVKKHYHEMIRRVRYIKKIARRIKESGDVLTEENWKLVARKHDSEQLIFDDYEKKLLFHLSR